MVNREVPDMGGKRRPGAPASSAHDNYTEQFSMACTGEHTRATARGGYEQHKHPAE